MNIDHNDGRILAILLLVFLVLGVLLSPLGFETRAPAFLSSPSFLPWLGLGLTGLSLSIVSLVLVFFKPRIASMLAIIGSFGSVALFLGDQMGVAAPVRPPPAITVLETVTTVVIAANIFIAARLYKESGLPPRRSGPPHFARVASEAFARTMKSSRGTAREFLHSG